MIPTKNTFEDRLLDALLDRFDAQLQHSATAHVSAFRHARIRRYAVPAGCLAVAATAASLMLTELGGPASVKPVTSATPAYALAAWTAQPTSASQQQTSTAESLCSAYFGQGGASQPGAVQKAGPPLAGGPWSPKLVDTRGDLTLALYSDGTNWMSCLASPSFVSLGEIDATGEAPVAENSATLDKVSNRQASGDPYTFALGRTGSAVTAVALQRVDGSLVTATVGDGHFIAWWPYSEGVKALSVTTATGTQSYPVDPRFARSGLQPTNKVVRRVPGSPGQLVPATPQAQG